MLGKRAENGSPAEAAVKLPPLTRTFVTVR